MLELGASAGRARARLELATSAGPVCVTIEAPTQALAQYAQALAASVGGVSLESGRDVDGEAAALLQAVDDGDPYALALLADIDETDPALARALDRVVEGA